MEENEKNDDDVDQKGEESKTYQASLSYHHKKAEDQKSSFNDNDNSDKEIMIDYANEGIGHLHRVRGLQSSFNDYNYAKQKHKDNEYCDTIVGNNRI